MAEKSLGPAAFAASLIALRLFELSVAAGLSTSSGGGSSDQRLAQDALGDASRVDSSASPYLASSDETNAWKNGDTMPPKVTLIQ